MGDLHLVSFILDGCIVLVQLVKWPPVFWSVSLWSFSRKVTALLIHRSQVHLCLQRYSAFPNRVALQQEQCRIPATVIIIHLVSGGALMLFSQFSQAAILSEVVLKKKNFPSRTSPIHPQIQTVKWVLMILDQDLDYLLGSNVEDKLSAIFKRFSMNRLNHIIIDFRENLSHFFGLFSFLFLKFK